MTRHPRLGQVLRSWPAGSASGRALLALTTLLATATTTACGDDSNQDPTATGDGDDIKDSITVFAAASLTDAFEELSDDFTAVHPDASVTFSFAGSSSLREQIVAGAPADVFASADEATMADVDAAGALAGEPSLFASNRLEIAVPAGNPGDVTDLADLAESGLLVGLCVEEVPCGHLADDVLDSSGVDPSVDTYEPSVRSLLTKIEAGELDAGLVYRTDVQAANGAVEGIAIPIDQNRSANYPIARLDDSGSLATAQAFIDFVLSDVGQSVLASHGFESPHR